MGGERASAPPRKRIGTGSANGGHSRRRLPMSGSGGSIRQRSNGLWEARYVGADGRRHSTYARTKGEAQQKLRAGLVDADHGIRPASGRLTVGQWLETWLSTSVEQRNR